MTGEGARPALDSALISALLEARDDAATAAFDDALEAAEASGRVDAVTARELRYWQRRSLEGVIEHAAHVVPAALTARSQSDAVSRDNTAEARLSWVQARSLLTSNGESATSPAPSSEGALAQDSGAPSRTNVPPGLTVVTSDSVPRDD